MRNILQTQLPEDEIADILTTTAGRPVVPPMGSPPWKDLRSHPVFASWFEEILAGGRASAAEPLPDLTDELYSGFYQTGERIPFERVYFERRKRLVSTAMAMLLGGADDRDTLKAPFLSMLEDVAGEESWSVPAHVWTRPDGKDPMMIDLMAAGTAVGLAEMLVLFGEIIPDDLALGIRNRLRVRIFENYLHRDPPFHWAELPMNWNAVCHHGVLAAALAIEDDHRLVAGMLARAARALPAFLSGFGDDGSTSEGPGYWAFGFGRFSELNSRLEQRTNGELSLFEKDPRIPLIARFAPQLTLSNGRFVNFSDGSATGWLPPALLVDLGRRLDDPFLMAHGIASYRQLAQAGFAPLHQRVDTFCITQTLLRLPSSEAIERTPPPEQPDAYFPDYGALVARGTDAAGNLWEFAAKAGHNAEHHNHNDCGSFLLNVNGQPVVVEIGAPEYVGDYFNSDETRYTFLAARSLGHSVPLINGQEQHAGAEFRSTVVEHGFQRDFVSISMDLTKAYPDDARCTRLIRTFRFLRNQGCLEVRDEYSLTEAGRIESMIIQRSLPGTENVSVAPVIVPIPGTDFAGHTLESYRDHGGGSRQVCRSCFRASSASKSGTVGIRIQFESPDQPHGNEISTIAL